MNRATPTSAPVPGDPPGAACVYTTMIGRYETLNEQPVAAGSALRFICLTDDPDLRSETWEIRLCRPALANDPVRSQRDLKIRPHLHLPDFDRSLYIDNSVLLKAPPERLLDLAAAAPGGLLLPRHSERETVEDEFAEVEKRRLDDPARIREQRDHMRLSHPSVLRERPWWNAILVRDHRNAKLRAAMELWAQHVMRYSRRDQLSLNLALHEAGLVAMALEIDNNESEFHSWPHIPDRTPRLVPPDPPPAMPAEIIAHLKALEAECRALQQAVAERDQRLTGQGRMLDWLGANREAMLRSTSWRITAPLRWLGGRLRRGTPRDG